MRRAGVALALALGCGPGIGDAPPVDATSSTSMSSSSTGVETTSTSTSGEASSSGSAMDLGDWPPGFIMDPDGESVAIECSVWDQDCPRGEKCMPWAHDGGNSWTGTRCSPIAPQPGQPGESCMVEGNGVSGIDDCDIASMCWGVNPETNMGRCVAFCVGSENNPICTQPNHECNVSADGTTILCMPRCNPLEQDCPDGEACWAIDDDFVCAYDASGEMGAFGDPCKYPNACDPGLYCADASVVPDCEGFGCCTPFCDLQAPECPDGTTCVAYLDPLEAPPGYENVGVCVVPR